MVRLALAVVLALWLGGPGEAAAPAARSTTLPAVEGPEATVPAPPAVAALACADGRACNAAADAALSAVATPNAAAFAAVLARCDHEAHARVGPYSFVLWRACVELGRPSVAALPAAAYRLPKEGWLVFGGESCGARFCWVAIDLATGSYWAMTNPNYPDDRPNPLLDAGQVPPGQARDLALLTLLSAHAKGRQPSAEAKIPLQVGPEPPDGGEMPDLFVKMASRREEMPPAWRWLSLGGAILDRGDTSHLGSFLEHYRDVLLQREADLRANRAPKPCPRAAPPLGAFVDTSVRDAARTAVARAANRPPCRARPSDAR
jgi:hypothetical protein